MENPMPTYRLPAGLKTALPLAFLLFLGLGADAKSCLWKATSDAGTLYLQGSVHILKADAYPLAPAIEQAYAASDAVVFETDMAAMLRPETQQAIMAMGNIVTFPQMFLSGIFYSIDILPAVIQPVAKVLPLSFLANGLRDIVVNGAGFFAILPNLLGLAAWSGIFLILAIRAFVWKEVAA